MALSLRLRELDRMRAGHHRDATEVEQVADRLARGPAEQGERGALGREQGELDARASAGFQVSGGQERKLV